MTSKINEWSAELQAQGWQVDPTPVWAGFLLDGQHRLHSQLLPRRIRQNPKRQRRMVQVTTLKYRARRKRK